MPPFFISPIMCFQIASALGGERIEADRENLLIVAERISLTYKGVLGVNRNEMRN